MKPIDIYTPVDDGSPVRFGWVISNDGSETIPLEKQESVYVFTAQELEARDRERDQRVAGEAFDAGCLYNADHNSLSNFSTFTKRNKSQYLNNLKTQQP